MSVVYRWDDALIRADVAVEAGNVLHLIDQVVLLGDVAPGTVLPSYLDARWVEPYEETADE